MGNLSELAKRVLSELEEAHIENVPSTINTIIEPLGHRTEVECAVKAFIELMERGHIRLAFKNSDGKRVVQSVVESLTTARILGEKLHYDAKGGYWGWDEREPLAEIVVTEVGLAEARQILDVLGYQWWRNG